MAIKLKKTLYVGIGGTGVATLLKIKKCFVDSYGEIPPMIGFLAIDTFFGANNQEEKSNRGEVIKLDATELLVCTVRDALSVYRTNPQTYDWVPPKNVGSLNNIQGNGAGQVRSNGRFIAYYNNKKIKDSIQSAVAKIPKLLPLNSRYALDEDRDGNKYATNINVFASIAGGTGSGMLIDVLSMIRDSLRQQAETFHIYPWITLPDIFRTINSGPCMFNVFYNSYGALRTLDYIMHHKDSDPEIDLGHSKADSHLFDYAFVINYKNQAGTTFDNLDDLVDAVAKSAFLPANKMGDDIKGPFDNILNLKEEGVFDIINKKAWAASAGSAELIYDSQMVGRAFTYSTIGQLCDSMLQSQTDGSSDANAFFDDQDVLIRENNGRDDVINALLSPYPIYPLTIDENTTESDINSYINENCGPKLDEDLKKSLDTKLLKTRNFFEEYISKIMERPQGKVGNAIKFVESLQKITSICKGEMQTEESDFQRRNSQPKHWSTMLNSIKNTGIKSLFSRVDEEAVQILLNALADAITNKREEIRRSWALKFYTSFEDILEKKLQELKGFKAILIDVAQNNRDKLLAVQNGASSKSKFQISLHADAVKDASNFQIDDVVKTNFVQYLGNGGLSLWIGLSQKSVEKKLMDFVEGTSAVQAALNTKIDDVLKKLPEEDLKYYLDRLKLLASPLWTYDTQGYNKTNFEFDRFFIIGVGDRETSMLSTDDKYKTYFNTNSHITTFASTYQYDRVYALSVMDLLPIYAVINFSGYEKDTEEKLSDNYSLANYLDEKLNNRMNADNFSLKPTIQTSNVLQYWVWGFVFGYIHYDKAQNQYWMRSKKRGDAIRKYRFNLSHQRDVAYNIFKSELLYDEVKADLDSQIAKNGRQLIDNKISEIKEKENYDDYAQLSPLESSNIDDPKFKSVRDLYVQEIGLMSK